MRLLPTLVLLLASIVGAVATFPSVDSASSSSSEPVHTHANANVTEARAGETCVQPPHAVKQWYYKDGSDGPYECTSIDDKSGRKWAMLMAYRRGSKHGVYFKWTNDANDPACLEYWAYYNRDGTKFLTRYARVTTMHDVVGRKWCPLAVYRAGGKQGKQWDYCICT